MTYANLYAIFLQIYLLSPARFLLRITRISAYTPAGIIYKKSLFLKKMFAKFVNIKNLLYLCTEFAISMEVVFQKDYLKELYYTGKTSDKQHLFQPDVVRKYAKAVGILEAVSRMEDLFRFNALHFEALQNTENYFSVRIDYHYRLVFWMEAKAGETTFTICNLEDITNHYQ